MYQPYFVSIAAAVAETQLVKPGLRIGEIAILSVPDGGEIWLRVGNNPDFIQVTKAVTFAPDNDNDANFGLTYKVVNPLAGGQVQVLVSWGGALRTVLV